MSAHSRHDHDLARQLFKLSLEGGAVSPERVSGVLAYIEKHSPANPVIVLREYHRLIAAELARSRALIEHAGPLPPSVEEAIGTALSRKYRRPITVANRANPSLIAGLRVRVGDDVYEASIAGQLAALGSPE